MPPAQAFGTEMREVPVCWGCRILHDSRISKVAFCMVHTGIGACETAFVKIVQQNGSALAVPGAFFRAEGGPHGVPVGVPRQRSLLRLVCASLATIGNPQTHASVRIVASRPRAAPSLQLEKVAPFFLHFIRSSKCHPAARFRAACFPFATSSSRRFFRGHSFSEETEAL